MGDGEINEGSVWEAAMCAGKHGLANLTAVIDYNKLQSAGPTREIQDLEPLADKWRAFDFAVDEVDGHDVARAARRCSRACRSPETGRRAIICHTVKGKGVRVRRERRRTGTTRYKIGRRRARRSSLAALA